MITSSILLVFIGSFFLYSASQKATLDYGFIIVKWVQSNLNTSKLVGISCLVISLLMVVSHLGRTSGILFWLIALMTIFSLIILIAPLKKMSYKHMLLVFLGLLIFELFF